MEGAADGDSNLLLDGAAVADRIRRSSRERRRLREIAPTGTYVIGFRALPQGRMLKMKMLKNEKGELLVIVRFSRWYS